jgi:hypothetical protein
LAKLGGDEKRFAAFVTKNFGDVESLSSRRSDVLLTPPSRLILLTQEAVASKQI